MLVECAGYLFATLYIVSTWRNLKTDLVHLHPKLIQNCASTSALSAMVLMLFLASESTAQNTAHVHCTVVLQPCEQSKSEFIYAPGFGQCLHDVESCSSQHLAAQCIVL